MGTENKEKNNYIVLFKGVKLPKREANKVGLGIIFGIIGIFVSFLIVGRENKILGYIIIFIFIAIGYFWLGNKIFKK